MTWTTKNMVEQKGKTVIVTGANSGIGFETARVFAAQGARVILACRNATKGEDAVLRIRAETPGSQVENMALDLSSLDSVRNFARSFMEKQSRLDGLINNGGVMVPPFSKTADGFELQFGTNYLGHFALTGLLLPLLEQTPGARVVTVSSVAHRAGKIDLTNLNAERKYSKWCAYGQSKLACLMFSYELQRRLSKEGTGTISVAAHPGWTATNLQKHTGPAKFLNPYFGMETANGALPTLYAATAPDVIGGDYYGPDGFLELKGNPKKVRSSKRSQDHYVAAKLWAASEELTGVGFLSKDDLPEAPPVRKFCCCSCSC